MTHQLKRAREFGFLVRARWLIPSGCSSSARYSSAAIGHREPMKMLLEKPTAAFVSGTDINRMLRGATRVEGISLLSGERFRRFFSICPSARYNRNCNLTHSFSRRLSSSTSQHPREERGKEETKKGMTKVEDPFDDITYNIPEKPVTFAEGASYSIVILAGLGIAALAAYAVFKELIFEPKEYKIFGKALERVQKDNQVTVRIGSPVTGYGQESRNRAARQRIPNRVWTDEDGVEHVEVNFYIRGPHGAGKVFTEMFKDRADKTWKFTYLIVEIRSPSQAQLMLESYVPA